MAVADTEPFHKNIGDMLLAAERCKGLRQHMPALALVYSLIDSLAWAAADRRDESVRKRFEAWVTEWLIPHLSVEVPEISPTDLYAARCAVLHTLTSESDLSRTGKAKRVMYAWGTAEPEVLRAAIREGNLSNHVAMHFDDLFASLWSAVEAFLESANDDEVLAKKLDEAAGRHYLSIPVDKDHGADVDESR
jgi:hypothetical protein